MRHRRSSAGVAVALGVAVCSLIVVVGYFLLGNKGWTSDTSKEAGGKREAAAKEVPAEEETAFRSIASARDSLRDRIKRAEEFLMNYPRSTYVSEAQTQLRQARSQLESAAQNKWEALKGEFDRYYSDRRYEDLLKELRSLAEEFRGTEGGDAAIAAVDTVEVKWNEASRGKLDAIDLLIAEKKYDEAWADIDALLAWCNTGTKVLADVTKERIGRLRASVDVASTEKAKTPKNGAAPEAEEVEPGESGEVATTEETPPEEGGTAEKPEEGELDPGLFPDPEKEDLGLDGDDKEKKKSGKKKGNDGADEEITPGTDGSGKSEDWTSDEELFGDKQKASEAVKNHPIIRVIKKEGLERVQKEIERLFSCSKVTVTEDGRVRIIYDFSDRDERIAKDWTPKVGNRPTDKIRWSVDYEGGFVSIFYGIRISERGVFCAASCFSHDVDVEVCFHSASGATQKSHVIAGVFDDKAKTWYGSDFGAQAVKADAGGKVRQGNPAARLEAPGAETIRWFRVTYKSGALTSYFAQGGGRIRLGAGSEVQPNYRKSGELRLKQDLVKVRPGVVFYSDICGTIGYVRITGLLDPEWLKQTAAQRGCRLSFDPSGLDDI